MNTRAPSRRYDSVQQDWRSFLPEAKADLYYAHSRALERAYDILSIALDEAIGFRQDRQRTKALQTIVVTPELWALVSLRLESLLHAMRQQARHFGIIPNLALLELANFRTERGRHAVRLSNLLSYVLLSERSQFLQKLSTLEEILNALGDCFCDSVRCLAEDAILMDSRSWENLVDFHFDLNTCLRETQVLFKSFLIVLPEDRLAALDFTIRGLYRVRPPVTHPPVIVNARRMSAVAGK